MKIKVKRQNIYYGYTYELGLCNGGKGKQKG